MSKRRKRLEARARRYPAPPRGARPAPYLPGVSGGIALGRVWIGTPLTRGFPWPTARAPPGRAGGPVLARAGAWPGRDGDRVPGFARL